MYIRYAVGDMKETQAHVEGGHVECPIVSCENVRGESRAVAISRQSLHDLQLDGHSPDDVAKVRYVVHI